MICTVMEALFGWRKWFEAFTTFGILIAASPWATYSKSHVCIGYLWQKQLTFHWDAYIYIYMIVENASFAFVCAVARPAFQQLAGSK